MEQLVSRAFYDELKNFFGIEFSSVWRGTRDDNYATTDTNSKPFSCQYDQWGVIEMCIILLQFNWFGVIISFDLMLNQF